MALLCKAALAMWLEIEPQHSLDFQHWHSHEHLPERLGIPGFLRAARWRALTELRPIVSGRIPYSFM